jgi:hypothetical protein
MSKASIRSLSWAVLILLLPFAVLYWLVPFWSGLTIGNDYIVYGIQAQIDLNHSLEHGSFPLYGPGFAGGNSTAAMTLGQLYHPISHIARLIPGYWDGHALEIYTLLKLLSLGIAQLFLFFAFKTYGATSATAFLITGFAIYNMRMLDHFRYGASLEAYTALMMLCACLMIFYVRRHSFLIKAGIVICSYLLVTSGHPQMAYLAYLSVALLLVFLPSVYNLFLCQKDELVLREGFSRLCVASVLIMVGILLALPYLSTFVFEFMSFNSARIGNDYTSSLAHSDTWAGVLRNLYMPLHADVGTAFAGNALWLLVFFLPLVRIFGIKPDKLIWSFYAFSIIIILVCMGDATPFYKWVWELMPLAENFRLPGRYSTLMILPATFILFWLLRTVLPSSLKLTNNSKAVGLSLFTALIAGILILLFYSLDVSLPGSGEWTPQHILQLPMAEHTNVLIFYLSLLACFFFTTLALAYSRSMKLLPFVIFGLACVSLSQTAYVLKQGTWIVSTQASKTLEQLNLEKRQSIELQADAGFGLTTRIVDEQLEQSILEPKLAIFYRNIHFAKSHEAAVAFSKTVRNSNTSVILSNNNGYILDEGSGQLDEIQLAYATYNRLDFEVETQQPGYLVTNIPFRENWIALVNGERKQTHEANGYALAVSLPKGQQRVEFRYQSPAFEWSILVSGVILFLFVLFFLKNQSKFVKGSALGGLVILYSFAGLLIQSLYNGESFGTEYQWTSNDFPRAGNLAYAKQTTAMNLFSPARPYNYYPGRAVDGNRSGKGYASAEAPKPRSWKVDLGRVQSIARIEMYGIEAYSFPLSLWASAAANAGFKKIANFNEPSSKLLINFSGLDSRYLVVSSEGPYLLHFAEFEVYRDED